MHTRPTFRIWNKQTNQFEDPFQCSLHCYSTLVLDPFTGRLFTLVGALTTGEDMVKPIEEPKSYYDGQDGVEGSPYVLLPKVPFKTKNKEDVYEGDVVEFVCHPGDFAWQDMTAEEAEEERKLCGQKFTCVVELSPTEDGLILRSGSNPSFYFPLPCILQSELVGNIYESSELRRSFFHENPQA